MEVGRFGGGGNSNPLKSPVERASARLDTAQPYVMRFSDWPLAGFLRTARGNGTALVQKTRERPRFADFGSSLVLTALSLTDHAIAGDDATV